MAADKTDQPGVLGNLPRSRPGQRSEKRGGAAQPAAARKTASKARKTASTARKPASTARKPAARKPAATAPRRERPAPQPATPPSPDPLTFALRTAGKVAEVGLKTASGILRRLPGR